jgi:hypothetical protein
MYVHNVVGTGSYTTSTANMYNKYRFHVPLVSNSLSPFAGGSPWAIRCTNKLNSSGITFNDFARPTMSFNTSLSFFRARAFRDSIRQAVLNAHKLQKNVKLAYAGGVATSGARINQIEKRLVLIILVLVFKHQIKIYKYLFV